MSGTTKILKPEINVNIAGKSYPCLSAGVSLVKGQPSSFYAEVTHGDTGFLTSADLVKTAASFQTKAFKPLNENDAKIEISAYGKLEAQGYITNTIVSASASTSGMAMRIEGTHKDTIIGSFNSSIYGSLSYDDDLRKKLNEKINKNDETKSNNIFINLMDKKDSLSLSVADRIAELLRAAMNNITEIKDNEDGNNIVKQNNQLRKEVLAFLEESSKTSKLYGDISPTSNIVNDAINEFIAYNLFYSNNTNLFNTISYIMSEFGLVYSPSYDFKKSGKFIYEDFNPKKKGNTAEGDLRSFNSKSAPREWSQPPFKQLTSYGGIRSSKDQYTYITGAYPKKPDSNDKGIIISVGPSSWMFVGSPSTDTKSGGEKLESKNNTIKSPQSTPDKEPSEFEKVRSDLETIIDKKMEQLFFKIKLENSSITVSTVINANKKPIVGERCQINAGTNIASGVLQGVLFDCNTGQLTTTYVLEGALLDGVSI